MEVSESSKTSAVSLLRTADFATLCSFIIHFGADLGIHLTFPQLLQFLELHKSANIRNWETLHVKLLNKLKYRARPDRWEPVLARFLLNHTAAAERIPEVNDLLLTSHTSILTKKKDGLGCSPYYSLDAVVRAKVLLYLLEAQFDRNQAFKDKVNLKSPADLRFKPLGYDIWGRSYWLLKDSDVNLLLYREDSETDSFELLCENTDEMRHLHGRLRDAHQPKTPLANILTHLATDDSTNSVTKEEPAMLCVLDTGETAASLSEPAADISPDSNSQDEIRCNGKSTVDDGSVEFQEVMLSVTTPLKTPPSTPVKTEEKEEEETQPVSINTTTCSRDALTAKLIGCVGGLDGIRQVVKSEEGLPVTDSATTCERGDQLQNMSDVAAAAHPSNCQNVEKPAVVTPQVDVVQSSKKEEALIIGVSGHRSTKRAHRSEPGAIADDDGERQTLVELRRSGRQRKPVMFLKMEPIQPKRSRLAPQCPKDGGTPQSSRAVPDVEMPSKRSRKNKKAASAALKTEKSYHLDNGKKTRKKKRKKKKRKGGKHPCDVWQDHSSSSLDSDEEDDYFEQVLLERERNDSDASDNGSVTRKACQSSVTWLDQPESDFHLSNISDDNSDTDSLIQGRNLARQKRLQRKLKAISEDSSSVAAADREPTDEQQCQVCLKSHLPEWLLLCDQCDLGHHTMCLRPALMTIPEGDWYCPRCRHVALVLALEETAAAIDAEQKKQVLWRRMQERLNFVNISMTNILAERTESTTAPTTGRRRVRNRPTTNVYEGSEESSREDQTTGSASTTSHSDLSSRDAEYSEEGGRKRLAASRRRPGPNGRRSSRTGLKRARFFRPDFSSDQEEDDDRSSSAGASPEPGPRTTRQRRAQYDLKEAFRGLDEAIEEDEKYREEKLQRQQRKGETSVQRGDADLTSSQGSPLPPGKSRGKDLSNILGPDWRDDDGDGRPSRINARSHRAAGRLSSSEEPTDGDGNDSHGFPGGRKRRHRESDSDFKPASESASASGGSSAESEASESTASGSGSSDQSWLCAASRRRKTARHGRSRSLRKRRRSSKAATGGQRRRGRPVPRFEADESYTPQRPRRSVRAVVSYRESDENADTDVGEGNRLRAGRARNAAQLDSDSDSTEETAGGEPSQRVCNRNRRILASDGEDSSLTGGGASPGTGEEARSGGPDEDAGDNSGRQCTTADGGLGRGEQANLRPAGDATSSCGIGEDTDDDDYSPSALVISETSPCEVKPKVVLPPLRPDDDEESVEEEADDLIPRHRLQSSSTASAIRTLGAVPHRSPSPPPAPPSAGGVLVSCLKSSPDLFS